MLGRTRGTLRLYQEAHSLQNSGGLLSLVASYIRSKSKCRETGVEDKEEDVSYPPKSQPSVIAIDQQCLIGREAKVKELGDAGSISRD